MDLTDHNLAKIGELIEISRQNRHRAIFVTLGGNILGNSGHDEENSGQKSLAQRISPIITKATAERPQLKTLWLYDKTLQLANKNQEKKLKKNRLKNQVSNYNFEQNDSFQQFINSTQIKYCFYNESQNILGSSYDICVLQDFAALTPNVLARAVETVSGGGMVLINIDEASTLSDVSKINLKAHDRMATSLFPDQQHRFSERFIKMLIDCKSCLFLDPESNIIETETVMAKKNNKSAKKADFSSTINEFSDIPSLFTILKTCASSDQIDTLLKIFDSICSKDTNCLLYLTSARGRGKSAVLGMSLALSIALGHSNIFVVAPSPDNLITLFQFVSKSLTALGYQENKDFTMVYDKRLVNADSPSGLVTSVTVSKNHRQFIRYIQPGNFTSVMNTELVCIDEAAAIPMPFVKQLLKSKRVLMASTTCGYEGTGRSLSLKLIEQVKDNIAKNKYGQNFEFKEMTLEEPIRYARDDPVEKWLNSCLCLGSSSDYKGNSDSGLDLAEKINFPSVDECELMKINRDILFSSNQYAEEFLSKLMEIFSSAHYRNSPNDLLSIADSASNELFCLVNSAASDKNPSTKPKNQLQNLSIITIILICYEGNADNDKFNKSYHTSGNMIPNVLSQSQLDSNFQKLKGARIIRIATNHLYQKMGYGSRALKLLEQYLSNFSENSDHENRSLLTSTKSLAVTQKLDYIGVSYGATAELYSFWERHNFIPMYMSNSQNKLTGEYSMIMLKSLMDENRDWIKSFNKEFLIRQIRQCQTCFRNLDSKLAANIVAKRENLDLNENMIDILVSPMDLKRLTKFTEQRMNLMNINDLIPILAQLYFNNLICGTNISPLSQCVLIGFALQGKEFEFLSKEINLPVRNINGIINQIIINFTEYLNERQLSKAIDAAKNKEL